MDFSSADMICVLKVNTQCEDCKRKVMQILQRVRGVYNIAIDGEEGTVKVSGRVNPSTLLRALQKNEKHAVVKYVKFDGEVLERSPMDYFGEYGYSHYDGMIPPPPPYLPPYPPPPPPYPLPYPFAPPPPPAPFPPHPPLYPFAPPHSLPTHWTSRPPPPQPPPAPPVEEPTQSKKCKCTIM